MVAVCRPHVAAIVYDLQSDETFSKPLTTSELPSLPIFREISRFFDQIMKISRSPDLESKSPDFLPKTMLARSIASFTVVPHARNLDFHFAIA